MPSSLDYLHALAEESGEYGSFTTTSAGTTTTLVCSRLANTGLSATEFANMFVLIEGGEEVGEIGHVLGGGLTRSTGTLTVADAFTGAIGSGVAFSLYRLLPPISGDNVLPSYLQVVNWALRRIPVERTIEFSGVTGQVYYSVSAATYPWWTDERRIRWVEHPTTSAEEVPRRLAPSEWEWDATGSTRRLVFPSAPFKTGDTFRVKVMAPGNSLLKKNGTWTEQTTQTAGLALYTSGVADEALPNVDDVVTMSTALLYRALSRLAQPRAEVAEWLAKMQPSMRAAKRLRQAGFAEDRTTGIARLRPVRAGYAGG